MRNNNSGHVLAAILGSFIAGLFLQAGILLTHYLSNGNQVTTYNIGNSGQTNPTGNQQPVNTQSFQCPSTDQVASLMNFAPGSVNNGDASCVYR